MLKAANTYDCRLQREADEKGISSVELYPQDQAGPECARPATCSLLAASIWCSSGAWTGKVEMVIFLTRAFPEIPLDFQPAEAAWPLIWSNSPCHPCPVLDICITPSLLPCTSHSALLNTVPLCASCFASLTLFSCVMVAFGTHFQLLPHSPCYLDILKFSQGYGLLRLAVCLYLNECRLGQT